MDVLKQPRQERSMLELAERYCESGFSVIPFLLNGEKRPAFPWKEYETRIPTDYEVREWFKRPGYGLGIVCGRTCDCPRHDFALEVMDFDAGELFEPWREQVADIVERLPVVKTPTGGYHAYYRCLEYAPNTKIAMDRERDRQTLIETRGAGGCVVACGNPLSIHPLGKPYCHHSGPEVFDVPMISPDERAALWRAARAFNRDSKTTAEALRSIQPKNAVVSSDCDPHIARFNAANSISSMLEQVGWHSRDGKHWTRPGKTFGTSASIVYAQDGTELLRVFSSSANLPTDRSMSAFELYKQLAFGGDGRAAYRTLRGVA